jgi:hypothetical protein
MPVEVKKIRNQNLYPKGSPRYPKGSARYPKGASARYPKGASARYQVKNTETGKIHAKGTTKEKAEAQARLLNAIYAKEKSSKKK